VSELAYIGPGGRRPSRPLLRTLIGEALRRNRQGQRRTLADVARQARVSVPYLSEVERGRKEASSEVLAAVCDALRVELSDLLAEVGRELTRDTAPVPVLRLGDAELRRADLRRADLRRADLRRAAPRSGDVVLLAA
jgi:transcriptional regulator with XRE-family HTH domain